MTTLMRVFLAALCFIGLAHAQNEPLPADRAVRGEIGLPRVLNMY